jgi:uncharacterized protein
MYVARLWRYPVKSLSGESQETAQLTGDGVAGDRLVHVAGEHGPLTGRTRPALLTLPADTGPDGVPRIAGHPWHSRPATDLIRAAAGSGARLVAYAGPERFDILNLLVATDGAVAALGADVRRLRPNILIGGVPAAAEQHWPGHALAIGEAVIGVFAPRQRCIVTTIDPDSGEQDLDVLRRIRHQFGGALALDCWVIRPGAIRTGDPVSLQKLTTVPPRVGGWIAGAPYPDVLADAAAHAAPEPGPVVRPRNIT